MMKVDFYYHSLFCKFNLIKICDKIIAKILNCGDYLWIGIILKL